MATGLLPNLETQASGEDAQQPAYLTRLATLPLAAPERSEGIAVPPQRPEAARLDQIEHALTILASVVGRLAKDAQQSRLQLRATEHDPSLQEERRVQRELVRSMQARLNHIEERMERQVPPPALPAASPQTDEVAAQLAASLHSIRDSLAALTKRKSARPQ